MEPSTRESLVLPYPRFSLRKNCCTLGLGYDYKILKIDNESRSEIFSLTSGSLSLMDKQLTNSHSLVFVNGAFHWPGW